jgi:hypothetical protein
MVQEKVSYSMALYGNAETWTSEDGPQHSRLPTERRRTLTDTRGSSHE